MKKAMLISLALPVALSLSATTGYAQDDVEAGMNKFYTCTGCHAITGYTNTYPTYHVPRLAGQHPEYIVAALNAYKSGARSHKTMIANASTLSDQDMANIAAFIAGVGQNDDETTPVTGNAAAGAEKSAVCAACHGADGNSTIPTNPRLAGQYEDYLRKALKDYRSGARSSAIMAPMAQALSDQDIADLAAYFASQKRALSTMPVH